MRGLIANSQMETTGFLFTQKGAIFLLTCSLLPLEIRVNVATSMKLRTFGYLHINAGRLSRLSNNLVSSFLNKFT